MAKPQLLEEVGKVSELKTNDKTVVGGINEVLEKEKSNEEQINILEDDRGYLNTRLISDANLAIESGKYILSTDGLNNPLPGNACTITTIRHYGMANGSQIAVVFFPTSIPFVYVRGFVNGEFSPWQQIITKEQLKKVEIPLPYHEGFTYFDTFGYGNEIVKYADNHATLYFSVKKSNGETFKPSDGCFVIATLPVGFQQRFAVIGTASSVNGIPFNHTCALSENKLWIRPMYETIEIGGSINYEVVE